MSSADESRRKSASLLLALVLALAAVLLTILYLEPGTRVPEGAGPGESPQSVSPSPTPTESSAAPATSGRPAGGGGTPQCVADGSGELDCPRSFTIVGNAVGLYPGGTVQLPLTFTNPNQNDIRVTSVTVSVTGSSRPSCGASNLRTSSYSGPGFVVPGNGSGSISLPLTMSHAAPDACQNVTFTLSYGGRAEEA